MNCPLNNLEVLEVHQRWQKRDKYRRAEITDGVAIQLAVYAKHVDGAAQDIATGYFMLRQKRFVTNATHFAGSVVAVNGESPGDTWIKVSGAWRQAMDEISSGKVRATFDSNGLAQSKFADDILLTPPKCDYCDYQVLCARA